LLENVAKLTYKQRTALFADEDLAREYVEQIRWKGEPFCPHCGTVGAYKLTPKPGSARPTRKGVYKCKACRKQFTVTVGTVFEGTRIKLNLWLWAIYLMCSSKKGISAFQIHRELGCTYKTAWFLCHRVRKAMEKEPLKSKLSGVVEVDETYVGGKGTGTSGGPMAGGSHFPVFSMVSRTGDARSFLVPDVKAPTLYPIMLQNIDGASHIMTDEMRTYRSLHKHYWQHSAVAHSRKEYVRGIVSTNFAESYFSLLKRGIFGAFHHISKKHAQRYLEEFDFRWNMRKATDDERFAAAIQGAEGKRLLYRLPVQRQFYLPFGDH
jgi:transposase-like protein